MTNKIVMMIQCFFFLHKFGSLENCFGKIFNICENKKIKVKAAKVSRVFLKLHLMLGFEAYICDLELTGN